MERLVKILESAELKLSASEIADVIWLATLLNASGEGLELSQSIPLPQAEPRLSDFTKPPVPEPEGEDIVDIRPQGSYSYKNEEFSQPGTSGASFLFPAASALPGELEIGKSIKLFKRRVPSRSNFVLDEEATIRRIDAEKLWIPVLRPAPARWLDVALIVDSSPSMVIWNKTINEFRRLLEYQGAFRNVWVWNIRANSDGQIELFSGMGNHPKSRLCNPAELIDPSGQRLFLVASDCVSDMWAGMAIGKLLASWGRHGPLAILQMLSQRMWARTALNDLVPVYLGAPSFSSENARGTPNQRLRQDLVRKGFRKQEPTVGSFPIPVISLQPELLKNWSELVMGFEQARIPGYFFPIELPDQAVMIAEVSAVDKKPSAIENYRFFKETASPEARKLATFFAANNILTLPMMRVIQHVMLPSSQQVHLAEVFLSGLLRRVSEISEVDPEKIFYRFDTEIQDLLLDSILASEANRILMTISRYAEQHVGHLDGFQSILSINNNETLNPLNFSSGQIFARIHTSLLKRLGGSYAQLISSLDKEQVSSRTVVKKHFSGWKKIFVSSLKKQIETVLGENAIDEIKQPRLQKELSEKLSSIYDTVEKQFLEQIHDDEIREAISSLPLASLQQAFGDFFRQPQTDKLNAALKSQLKVDYSRLPEDQIDAAVHLYTKILHNELAPLSEQFQQMSVAYSLEKISSNTNQLDATTSLLRELVGHVKNNPTIDEPSKNGNFAESDQSEYKSLLAQSTITDMSSNLIEKIDFVLVTALEEERDALLSKLPGYRSLPPSNKDTNFYYLAELPVTFADNSKGAYKIIVLPLLGMGRVQTATATTNAVQRWQPRFVLSVGIAGGVEARGVKLGDVLVSDRIVDYELQKITPNGPEVRWKVYGSSPSLLTASKEFSTEKSFESLSIKRPGAGQAKRHIGLIASGDKVIAFGEVLNKYRETWTELIGVEMESAGAAMASFQSANPPGFFMVRAVSDLVDKEKRTPRAEKWRVYACDIAAAYTVAFLKSGPVVSDKNNYGNHTAPAIHIRPELPDYEDYPWLPFMSYRYLESLDSARFNDLSRDPEIKMLNGKSELLEALLFGDGIALSEPQLIDSRGAVDALGELINAAKDVGIRIPIRLASRNPGQSVFDLASSNIGNIDETQLSRRYVISANPGLDLDVSRRKLWSQQLTQGLRGINAVLKGSSETESEFVTSLFTTLNYIDHEGGFVIPARNEPDRFYREVKQVLSLTNGDLEDMCQQKRDADIPEIMHPQWFANRNEAEWAVKLIAGLQSIVNKLGGDIPKGRSPIYTELAILEKEDPLLAEGIKEVVDSIYNHVVGLAGSADSLSDTTGGDAKNIYVRAGHAISQWARQTEKKEDGDYRYELPWAWGGASQLTWSKHLDTSLVKKVVKVVPWQAILEATKEPVWKESLVSYRTAMGGLQVVDRTSISLGIMGDQWRQKHLDARKALNDAWQKHIELSARLISNQYWKLTLDGMQYYSPEGGTRPLQASQSYRTMGTMTDFPLEMQQFRINAVHRNEFENNIYGMINEIAKKRQH